MRVHPGQTLSPAEIDDRAKAGDAACEATLRRYEARLGRALAGVINLLDPQVIVLGGGLSNLQRLYRNLPACCGPHVFSDAFLHKNPAAGTWGFLGGTRRGMAVGLMAKSRHHGTHFPLHRHHRPAT